MPRIRAVALAASAILALSIPSLSVAKDSGDHGKHASHGFTYGHDDGGLTWAILDGEGSTSMSGRLDRDVIEELKDRFGDRFLYIEDDGAGYVITDRALMERARRASRRIGEYGREIGEIARTQAKLSLSESRPKMRRAELLREQAQLRKEIDRAERRDEPTERLERRLDRVTMRLEVEDHVSKGFELSSDEKQDLKERRDRAKERLQEAVEQIQDEMRDILRTAKARHLAEPVD